MTRAGLLAAGLVAGLLLVAAARSTSDAVLPWFLGALVILLVAGAGFVAGRERGRSARAGTWLAGAALGVLNVGLFLLAASPAGLSTLILHEGAPVLVPLLAASVVGARWAVAPYHLARFGWRDAIALVLRGALAGSLVALVVAGALLFPAWEGIAFVALYAVPWGLAAGLACAMADVLLLVAARPILRGVMTGSGERAPR